MKKLMIAAAAVLCAVAVNAANVSWAIAGGVVDKDGQETTAGTAFLFITTGADKAPVWNSTTGSWNLNGAQLVALTLGSGEDAITYTGKDFDPNMGVWGDVDATSASTLPHSAQVTDNGQQYFSIILTSESTTDFDSFKGDDKYAAVVSGQASQESGFDEGGTAFYYEAMFAYDDITAASWTQLKTDAVPEPTSGLLLLLGVAGLALRRRRA